MNQSHHLAQILFDDPTNDTYAVLDGASIPDLLDQLDGLHPEHVCLYRGELKDGLDIVAPYLVRLTPGHPFTRWLLSNGWGRHYGVFLHCNAPISAIRLHLRRALRIYTEDGQALLFRYYDPRVLRAFLPTLNAAEAVEFYGPIESFLCESEDPNVSLRFGHANGIVTNHYCHLTRNEGWHSRAYAAANR